MKMLKKTLGCVALSLLCATSAGCSSSHFTAFVAPSFVVLDEDSTYAFRATTADGMVIAVRELSNNSERGDLAFWVKAIENRLRLDEGYALLEKKDVKTNDGLVGTQLRFGLDRDELAHVYIMTVFVKDRKTLGGERRRVYVIEAGGTEDLVKRHQAQLDWTIAEFVAK